VPSTPRLATTAPDIVDGPPMPRPLLPFVLGAGPLSGAMGPVATPAFAAVSWYRAMMGGATNCEIDGSSGGAADGLNPNAASDIATGWAPATVLAAGATLGTGAGAGAVSTAGAAGAVWGAAAGGGDEPSDGRGVAESLDTGCDVGGGLLATSGAGLALGGGGGAAAGSVPPRSTSEL
jgi:hypothetical protein